MVCLRLTLPCNFFRRLAAMGLASRLFKNRPPPNVPDNRSHRGKGTGQESGMPRLTALPLQKANRRRWSGLCKKSQSLARCCQGLTLVGELRPHTFTPAVHDSHESGGTVVAVTLRLQSRMPLRPSASSRSHHKLYAHARWPPGWPALSVCLPSAGWRFRSR